MHNVVLSSNSLTQGGKLTVTLRGFPTPDYQQVQVEIVGAAVANPANRMGIGTTPGANSDGSVSVTADLTHLEVGYYEIGLVRLHTPRTTGVPEQQNHLPKRDFERQVFEIRDVQASPSDQKTVLQKVEDIEAELARGFHRPVNLESDASSVRHPYTCLVFVRDVLLGVRMRFDHFEVIPTHSGLEGDEELRFVNAFLRRTHLRIEFAHDDHAKALARQSKPVFVLHFPSILASSREKVRDYCVGEAETLLFALALSRDAGGIVLDTVVMNMATGEATKFAVSPSDTGNLLTGSLSGENFEQVSRYIAGIRSSDMNRFLVGLYKEARRERSYDFQYVRLWQILETMADARDYDASQPLVDFEGQVITENGRAKTVSGSVNIVFNLLRENQIGSTAQTWKNVNVWFAFRNAVAHHGAVSRFHELSRESVREWARQAVAEISSANGIDHYLMFLKDDVNLLLMRRLVDAPRPSPTDAPASC